MEAASQQRGQPWHSRVVGRLCPPRGGDALAKWPQPRGRLPHLATTLLPPGQPAELPGVPTASPHAALSRGGKSTARSPSQVDLLFAFFFFLLLSQGICGKMLPCLKFVTFASAAAPVGESQLLIYAYPHRDIKNNRSVETRQWDFNSLGRGPRSVHVHLPPIYVCVFNGKVCQGVLSWFSWDSALYKYLSSHRIPNNFLEKLPLWRGSK